METTTSFDANEAPDIDVDFYPLSPLQEGMLFHTLYAPGSGVYVNQLSQVLSGGLDLSAFKRAWEKVITRHPILRTSFIWEGLTEPVQVVEQDIDLPLLEYDWSESSPSERDRQVESYLHSDRARGFELSRAPLMRITLIRLSESEYHFVWTWHHLLLDGWSVSVVLKEALGYYTAYAEGREADIPSARPYRDYIAWIKRQDLSEAEDFWRRNLGGIKMSRLFVKDDAENAPDRVIELGGQEVRLSESATAELQSLARQHHLTLNTIVKGAWALTLSSISGDQEMVFGGVISGRPTDLPGAESMVGLFVNALPVRVRVPPDEYLCPWFKLLQDEQVEAMRYGYISLADIQRFVGVQPGSTWFESILAFDNYPGEISSPDQARSLEVAKIRQLVQTNYPMSVSITPGRQLYVGIGYDASLLESSTIRNLLDQLNNILELIAANPNRSLSQLLSAVKKTAPAAGAQRAYAIEATDFYRKSNLTKFQLLTWAGQRMDPDVSQYISAGLVIIPAEIDRGHFQKALQKLVDLSDALRTVIEESGGAPRQRVLDEMICSMTSLDLSHSADASGDLREWAAARCKTPLDLSQRLFDVALIKLGGREYALYMNFHHLITDAWSDVMILRLLASYYELSLAGNLESAGPLPRYQDYVRYERECLSSGRWEKAQRYWEQVLSEQVDPISLYGNSTVRLGKQVERLVWEAGEARTRKLNEIISELRGQGMSQASAASNVFAALLCAYLYRFSGSRRLALGVPFHNRTLDAHRETIGLFMQVLPVRLSVEESETFVSLIKKFATQQLKSLRHRDYLVGNSLNNRVYDVYFNYITVPYLGEFNGAKVTREWVLPGHGNDSLSVQVHEDWGGNYVVEFDFHRDVFEHWLAQAAVGHFEIIVDNFLCDPRQPVSEMNLLSSDQRLRIIQQFNATDRDYDRERTISQCFESQAAASANKIAVEQEGTALTYGELNVRANQLARHLKSMGVGPEILVCLCLERSLDLIVAIMGVLKAGAGYVPLDPSYPPERLALMLADSRAPVLLSQERVLENLPAQNIQTICLDADWYGISAESADNFSSGATPDNLAYVIYTSGSTGTPKGTMIRHGSMVSYVQTVSELYGVEFADRVLQFCSMSFDISVEEIFPCLTAGGTLVLRTDAMLRSIPRFLENCAEWSLTMLSLPTAYWHEIVAGIKAESGSLPASMRAVIIAGERAIPDWLNVWQERVGESTRLINTYGLTESTVVSTVCELTGLNLSAVGSREVPVGYPIGNTQVYVLNRDLEPIPLGVPGELLIGGLLLARGYFDFPDGTAGRFIPDPFTSSPGSRLYRTGDMARHLADGNLEFLGRIDHQVKIRGFRIELEEIEATLRRHPAIRQAIVIATEDRPGNKRLVAYAVPSRVGEVGGKELRAFTQQKLPVYMVPSAFVILETLPLNPNGKVDRRALPAPDYSRPDLEKEFIPPETPVEKMLAEIWAEVLGIKSVGVHDNFFDLGGDSIRSVQVLAKAKEMGLDFTIPDLFQHLTIHELAASLALSPSAIPRPDSTLPFSLVIDEDRTRLPVGVEDAYPLAAVQTGMLFHTSLSHDSAIYQSISSLHVKAPFDLDKIHAAIEQVVARHPILRVSFDLETFSEPLQLVHKSVEVPVEVTDLTHLTAADQDREVGAYIESEKNNRFDWTKAPLLRFHIHLRGAGDFQFTRTEHHAIMDGWSHSAMVAELFQLYLHLLGETAEPIGPPPKSTYRDFVALEQAMLKSEGAKAFWNEKLETRTFTRIPRWLPPNKTSPRLCEHEVVISRELYTGLKRLASMAEAPLKTVLLGATLRVLSLVSGQSDVLTGLVTNSRPDEIDSERVLGVFLNSLPFRMDLSGDTWLELVRKTFRTEREYLPFRHYPYAELQRAAGGGPLFETLFSFIHFHVFKGVKSPRAEVLEMKNYAPTNYTLVIEFEQNLSSSELGLVCMYDSSQLCREQIEAIGTYFHNTLNAMVNQPFQRYELNALISEKERDQLISGWNLARSSFAHDTGIHALFQRQARQTPDAVALDFDATEMTYGELDLRTDQLARHLQTLGVSPQVLTGVYVDRSIDIPLSAISVLKAGGAYLPLDLAYPLDRLEFILSDAKAPVLITNESLADSLSEYKGSIVRIDTEWEAISRVDTVSRGSAAESQSPAYVIYTSGSTGRPKGVPVTHANLARLFGAAGELFDLTSNDVWTLFHSYAFDFSVWEMWGALLTGARLIIVPYLDSRNPGAFHSMIEREQVTVLNQTPSAFQQLMHVEEEKGELTSLRYVIFGGEALDPQSLKPWVDIHGTEAPRLINMYGITETTVHVTYRPVEAADVDGVAASMIGRPLPDLGLYILDGHLQAAPIGTPGEIYVAGDGLAVGYLNQPALTAQRFIPDPYGADGGRLYKSGDMARFMPSGDVEYMGRIDHQVKIRGYRIELGEIEAVLSGHPQVREAVVIAQTDPAGLLRLAAYVACGPERDLAADEVQTYLRGKLPDHMIPAAIVILPALPLTANGKVDRRNLPQISQEWTGPQKNFVPPRNNTEMELANLWADLFNARQVGVKDNFFDLGGHSLLAVRMMAQIKKRFGQDLPLAILFQDGTIADLARIIDSTNGGAEWSPMVPIQPRGNKPPFFCVHPLGGQVVEYYELSRRLGPEQPFYGLQAASLVDSRGEYLSIEQMATQYMEAIRNVQRQGPYYLGGYSYGGIVAYEIARRLREQGEEIALLGLIDAISPDHFRKLPAEHEEDDATLLFIIARMRAFEKGRRDIDLTPEEFQNLPDDKRMETFVEYLRKAGLLDSDIPQDVAIPYVSRFMEGFRVRRQALRDYIPKPYSGRITFFACTRKDPEHLEVLRRASIDVEDATSGWKDLSPWPVDIRLIDAYHEDLCREPSVGLLAEQLRDCLQRVSLSFSAP